jgi:TRAP-type C4-dicarboxylate transport system permease small subunit
MVLIAMVDVIGSKALRWPLPGSTEMTGIAQIVAIAGGLAFSKINGNHIAVTFLPDWLKGRRKAALEIFISLLGLGLFVIAGWMTYEYGLSMFDTGEKTQLLEIVFYPFAFWIALCCIPMCFVIIKELLNEIGRLLT